MPAHPSHGNNPLYTPGNDADDRSVAKAHAYVDFRRAVAGRVPSSLLQAATKAKNNTDEIRLLNIKTLASTRRRWKSTADFEPWHSAVCSRKPIRTTFLLYLVECCSPPAPRDRLDRSEEIERIWHRCPS